MPPYDPELIDSPQNSSSAGPPCGTSKAVTKRLQGVAIAHELPGLPGGSRRGGTRKPGMYPLPRQPGNCQNNRDFTRKPRYRHRHPAVELNTPPPIPEGCGSATLSRIWDIINDELEAIWNGGKTALPVPWMMRWKRVTSCWKNLKKLTNKRV